jgi:hypothetical protein
VHFVLSYYILLISLFGDAECIVPHRGFVIVSAEFRWNEFDGGNRSTTSLFITLIIFDKSILASYVSQLYKWRETPAGKVLAQDVSDAIEVGWERWGMAEIDGYCFGV